MKPIIGSLVIGIATMTSVACWTDARPAAADPPAPSDGALSKVTGKVVATMNADIYTYVQVDDGSKKIWAAAPKFAVAVGDQVVVPDGIPMRDFHSKTLDRTFDVVYFVSGIQVVGAESAKDLVTSAHSASPNGASPHGTSPHVAAGASAASVDLSNIRKADGGQTVAELFAGKAGLAGKDVVVRGRVVKYTPEVMGKNWLHVQDGSGSTGTNDLAVSTHTAAAVGNTVLVHGKLTTDKDYGFGYHYDLIIEDATVSVE
ncbi:MAG TPA: hypothetical protein VL403_18980 [Candidatus Kryptonia bacterium]|nr:hypothetical protein [Candidatus Kryptonia bacterium]